MKIVAIGLFIGLMGIGLFGRADDPQVHRFRIPVECDEKECTLPLEALKALHASNLQMGSIIEEQVERIKSAEAELAKLRGIKGCGKVEVLPKKLPERRT